MASVLEEYLRYRQMAKSDQPPSIFISSMVGPIKSKYLQPSLLTVDEVGRSINHFEFLPLRDSIAVLLYHRQKRQFLLIRRFRPAVAASHVLQLPRNKGKALGEINWTDCEEESEDEIGWTVELCSGRVKSKKENLDETALVVVEEKFGLRVDKKYLQHIGSFLTGVTDSGATDHLYYAELDCAEEISDGKIGSNPTMRMYWMDVEKMMKLITFEEECLMPSSHFYACLWWLPKYETINEKDMTMTPSYGVDTRCPFSDRRRLRVECRNGLLKGNWRLSEKKEKGRYPLMRLNYTINYPNATTPPSFKTRDITVKPDTVSILIKDVDSAEIVMTRRFRPAALVGRVMAEPANETSESASSSIYSKCVVPETPWTSSPGPMSNLPTPPSSPLPVPSTPEQLDFSSYVSPWAYTFDENETPESVHSSMNWKTQSMSPYPFAHLLTPPPSSSLPLPSTLNHLDFSSYPNSWAYTYELASARVEILQDVERVARNVALRKLGYVVTAKDIKFIGRVMIGSSEGGESKYLFYAECRANHRVRDWKDVKGVERVKLPLLTYEMFIQPSNSPPSVHIALIVMNGNDESRKPAIDDTKCVEWNLIERQWNESAVIESMEDELEKIVIQVAKDGMGNEEDEEDIDEMEMMNENEEREWIDSIYSIESVDVVDSEDEKGVEDDEEEAKDEEVEVNEEETNWTEDLFRNVDNQADLMINSMSAPIEDEMTEEERGEQFGWADADDYLLH